MKNKTYKFYRNFAILCGVLFVMATIIFFIATVKFLMLNPYGAETDSLRLLIAGTIIIQSYLAYLIVGCYRKWRRCIRYTASQNAFKRHRKRDAEYAAFIKKYF